MSKRVLKMGWIVVAALLCVSLAILPACGDGGGGPIPYLHDGMFIQDTIGDIDSFDPAWGYDTASGEQVLYVYEPLLTYDGASTDTFRPLLATEWAFNATDNTMRFKIREGVTFHEGGTLTPEDVEYSIERAMVQDRRGGPVWMFYYPLLGLMSSSSLVALNVTGFTDYIDPSVEVNGDWVVFNLTGPEWELAFLQILCGPWAAIVDKEWCIDQGDWPGTAETWLAYRRPPTEGDTVLYDLTNGTGPWKLLTWEHGDQITLGKFDDYWQGDPPFDQVITRVVDEWTNRKLHLINGDADLVYVPRMFIHELDEYDDVNAIQDLPELTLDTIFFNMCINEDSTYIGNSTLGGGIPTDFFSDLDVRLAFCYAFDYDTFLEDALLGEATQIASAVIDGLSPDYQNPAASMYSYNLTKAVAHLQAAWGGAVWDQGFKFTLLYNSGNVPRKTACDILSEEFSSIGYEYFEDSEKFQIFVAPIAWETYLDKIWGTMDMPMFEIGWMPDYPHPDNFVVPYMHSTDGAFSAYQCYGNSTVDAKIAAAFADLNPVTQRAKYYELQQIYYDDPGGIMLFQPLGRRFFTKYIDGFVFNPVNPGAPGYLYDMSKSPS
ncbi:MAG: ABC transporter substrate-binding protein [Dehalococcoidia bacterium]|nr:ABC transporter substrate-binding protein [Dehalococcoidia bacterium]